MRSDEGRCWQACTTFIGNGPVSDAAPLISRLRRQLPPGEAFSFAKTKNPCLNKETKAFFLCGTTLFARFCKQATQGSPGNGGVPEALTVSSALCSEVIFAVPSRPPCTKRRLSERIGVRLLVLIRANFPYALLSYPLGVGMSREKCRFFK